MKKARKLKSPIVVRHKGEWLEVQIISPWAKNWRVVTEKTDFVVEDTYHGLFRVTKRERTTLLEE